MPNFPIIDSHLHLWDPRQLTYPWLTPPLNQAFLPRDFQAATAPVQVEAMVFVECGAAPDQALKEARWVQERAHLEQLAAMKKARGARRIYQDEAEAGFCLQPDFIAGVQALPDYGLSFDMCIRHKQLQASIALADACPNTMIVLDHIAKPNIVAGLMQPWADQILQLAKRENVLCKLSGVATEAGANWTADTLRPYLEVALQAFGPKRLMFGGDWPVSTLAISYPTWVQILDQLLSDLSQDEQRQIYRNTAHQFYRLG